MGATDCTYDRMVIMEGVKEDFAGSAGVFRFEGAFGLTGEQAKAAILEESLGRFRRNRTVSDHFPVYGVFWRGRESRLHG